MPLSPDQLIGLLRARGIRVEVEELLRLHEALQRGVDWTPQRLENVIVGILATCPEDPPRIREAIRELRHAIEPALAPGEGAKGRVRARVRVGPPLVSHRLVMLGLVGVAAAAVTAALASRCGIETPSELPAESPKVEPPTVEPPDAGPAPESPMPQPQAESSPRSPTSQPTPANFEKPAPPPEQVGEPWTTFLARAWERADEKAQEEKRRAEEEKRKAELASWLAFLEMKRVVGASLFGVGLLGFAAVAVVKAWASRRRREAQRFGGQGLEVAPGPSLFWLAPRDPMWPPLLGVEAREALVWGVGHVATEDRTRFLDATATIDATIEHGGLPELRYHHRRRLRRVWLWHDQSVVGPIGARLCAEVQQTLHGYGLAVEVGRFWGLPERIERDDGRVFSLDALDEERELSTVIVIADGNELLHQWERRDQTGGSRQPHVRALLGRLAGWPHLTIVHTGSGERLRALRALLDSFGIPCVPLEAFPLAVRERDHLAQTLGTIASSENVWMWAAFCALYPLPVPEAMAIALLRRLELPISPLSLGQLVAQSVTTAGIQFKPQTRARLIERLRRALDDGSGALPRPMRRALAFWRAQTIAGDANWASDTTGRGLHRRLVVALLDLWTDPARAGPELSILWKSPHMPAIREEIGRMRPGKRPGPPEPGAFHVPINPDTLSPTNRTRLQAAGMGGLEGVRVGGLGTPDDDDSPEEWPWWVLVLVPGMLFVGGAALLVV